MSTLLSKSTLIPDEPLMNHDTRLQTNLRAVSPGWMKRLDLAREIAATNQSEADSSGGLGGSTCRG